jgi:hypothetical protein
MDTLSFYASYTIFVHELDTETYGLCLPHLLAQL